MAGIALKDQVDLISIMVPLEVVMVPLEVVDLIMLSVSCIGHLTFLNQFNLRASTTTKTSC